jgi:ABC-2 type transport system permease protein
MFTLRVLTISSIKMFLKNKQALFFTLFMPLATMLIFGVIGFDKPQKVDVGIVAQSFDAPSQAIVDQFKAFPSFTIHEGTENDELWALSEGDRAAVLDFPANFASTSTASSTEPHPIVAYLNEGQAGQAQTVVSILSQYLDKTTLAISHTPTLFTVEQRAVNSRNLRYIEFLLPGLIALFIMQMSVFSVAFVFTQYKEKGILKRLLATPMKPYQFVMANVITRLGVSLFQAAIFISVGVIVFHVHVIGSYALILLSVILGTLMFLGLGFTISGFAKTVETVPAVANLVVFPMMFLGGAFFSVANMPTWLQHIAKFLPLTYFSTALRKIMTEAAGFNDIKGSLLGMAVWAVILIGLATITFSFQEKDAG